MIDKQEAMQLLEDWRESYLQIYTLSEPIESVFGSMPECLFFNTLWQNFDRHTVVLTIALGDEHQWLSWYAHECDMGASPHSGSPPGGKMRKVKTLAQLLKIIEESRDV